MKSRIFNTLAASALAAALVGSLACIPAFAAGTDTAEEAKRTVTVNGSGYAAVTPDTAAIIFSVQSTADTAKAAQDENKAKTDAVLEALKALDLDEKAIKTSSYSLNPEYQYDDNGNASIKGYTANTELTVSGQTIDMAGTVLSAGVNSGVNAVCSVRFTSSTYDDAYKEALSEAVKNAQAKAEALALASGSALGKVVSMTEGYEDASLRSAKTLEAAALDSVALMPGEAQISATVTSVYELAD